MHCPLTRSKAGVWCEIGCSVEQRFLMISKLSRKSGKAPRIRVIIRGVCHGQRKGRNLKLGEREIPPPLACALRMGSMGLLVHHDAAPHRRLWSGRYLGFHVMPHLNIWGASYGTPLTERLLQ